MKMSETNWNVFSQNYGKFVAGRPKTIQITGYEIKNTLLTDQEDGTKKEVPSLQLQVNIEDAIKLDEPKIFSVTSKRLAGKIRPFLEGKMLPLTVKITKIGEKFDVDWIVE